MRASAAQAGRGVSGIGRVLGVDPGTVVTGWGVVEMHGRNVRHVESGVVRPRGSRADRLAAIYRALCQVCERLRPSAMSIEQTFVGDNIQTAFRLGEARGAVMVAAARAGLPVVEYSPAEIKLAVAGNGRAVKEQMQAMVGRLLSLDTPLAVDEADALGAAICHIHTSAFQLVVTGHQILLRRTSRVGRKVRNLAGRR